MLAFFSTENEVPFQTVPLLLEVQKRFKDRPLVVLAIHDATSTSVADLKKALDPIRAQVGGELPIAFLLDRPPIGDRPWSASPCGARSDRAERPRFMSVLRGPCS